MVLAVMLLLAVPGCASSGETTDRGSRDVLTRAQLEAVDHLTAYDAVRRYRPVWLRTERGQDSFMTQGQRGLRVYVDGIRYGGVEALARINVRDIEVMRFLDKRKATTELGTDHGEGAIMIETRP